jgi:hypothetical protein
MGYVSVPNDALVSELVSIPSKHEWNGYWDVMNTLQANNRFYCRIRGSHSGRYEEYCLLGYNAV